MNKNNIKNILRLAVTYIAVIGCIGGVVYWLWKNPIYNPVGPQVQNVQSDIEVRFRDATLRGRRGGIPYWTVNSKLVESERNSPIILFKDKPKGEFYNLKDWANNNNTPENATDNQDPTKPNNTASKPDERLRTFTWSADLAEYNTDTEDLVLKTNVDILTDDKDSIKTNELRWNNYEQKVRSNTRTVIKGFKGHPIVKADNIEGDVKMDILNLKGHVEIETVLDEDQEL